MDFYIIVMEIIGKIFFVIFAFCFTLIGIGSVLVNHTNKKNVEIKENSVNLLKSILEKRLFDEYSIVKDFIQDNILSISTLQDFLEILYNQLSDEVLPMDSKAVIRELIVLISTKINKFN